MAFALVSIAELGMHGGSSFGLKAKLRRDILNTIAITDRVYAKQRTHYA